MKRMIGAFLLLGVLAIKANTQNVIPKVANGKIERIANFASAYITARNIDIWLPEGYSSTSKYAVLYMQDGQMLFDASQTWNKQSWKIDSIASDLLTINKVKKFIVVGIWNGGATRHQDYFPQQPFEKLREAEKDTVTAQLQRAGRTQQTFQPQSDNYLNFIVKELKPFIDKHYAVYTDRANTFIAGSSMGALIAIYAICEYPEIFGGAACLSTHWVGTFTVNNNPLPDAFIRYLSKKLPDAKKHTIYFDCGNQTLDALYPPLQERVDSIMKYKGFSDKHWLTKYFPGEDHSEKAWSKRLHIPLAFLLKPE